MKTIDFSSKHDVMIRNADGTLLPMDVPYFESEKVAEGTWKISSDGDAQYLVEGDREAIVIDSGYGAGNLREYCQTLTDRPVRNIINTHDHFDHTANNCYFETAYMSAATAPLATIPFPSFEGIDFPRDYPKQIVKDGDKIDIGGRTLEVIEMPDHAVGSIVLLDSREKILFAGDEITGFFKRINTKVETVLHQFLRLQKRKDEISVIWPGSGHACPPELIDHYVELLTYIHNGGEAEPGTGFDFPGGSKEKSDQIVYDRFRARPTDMKAPKDMQGQNLRHVSGYGIRIVFDDSNM